MVLMQHFDPQASGDAHKKRAQEKGELGDAPNGCDRPPTTDAPWCDPACRRTSGRRRSCQLRAENQRAPRARALWPKPCVGAGRPTSRTSSMSRLTIPRMLQHDDGIVDRAQADSEKLTLLGTAPAFRGAIAFAQKVAPTDASVFITGESGSGKELIAQFIHQHSRRSSRPFVAVNCAALPEGLLESEMFGHRKGAFTGAVRDKPGLLEVANGGTLFLDELVEMTKPIQAKLLRVIQDGVVRRVGSESTDAVVNVRFIACTNRNPEEAVAAQVLREDLYYRLRVVPIHVPPLRERPSDIPALVNHLLIQYWNRHRGAATPLPTFSEAAVRALRARPWKGNVRELENVIEHMVVLLEPGAEIAPEHIPALGERPAEDLVGAPAWTPPRSAPTNRTMPPAIGWSRSS